MRHEYARAGYRMMSVTDPKLCQNTALRHSAILLACTTAMCYTGTTHWSFAADTLPFTLYLIYLSYRFRTDPSSQTSRKLFFYSLIYLPVVMFLMVISKNRSKSKPTAVDKWFLALSHTRIYLEFERTLVNVNKSLAPHWHLVKRIQRIVNWNLFIEQTFFSVLKRKLFVLDLWKKLLLKNIS